jgi:hypothetical protein
MSDPAGLRLPNLVIVGVSKAGTTSLFHYLRQHPDICASDLKELRYLTPLRRGEPLAPLAEYASHFAACGDQRYAMEATPGYFYGGQPLARGIRETCPSVRALVVLRSPEDRCWSFFQFVKSKVRIPKEMTFAAYLDRCEELQLSGADMDREHGDFSGLVKGCYARWLDAWTTEFGERFRILFFDDVVKDTRNCLKSVVEWLEIDGEAVDEIALSVDNKTVQYRRKGLQQAAVALNKRGQRVFERHPQAKRLLRRGYYSVNSAPDGATMTSAERARLTAFYEPHNQRLAEQLSTMGLSLPSSWSNPARATD